MRYFNRMNNFTIEPGSDLYYSWLFLEEPKKKAVSVLYEFCDTLARMLTLKENDIFMVKWAWWQQEMAQLFQHQATHPAAIALQDIISVYKIPPTLLQDYLDGIKLTRELDHCCTEEDFNAFSYRTRGILQTLAAYIYGFHDPQVLHYTRAIALPLSLMDEILFIGKNLRRDRVFLPLNTLSSWQEVSDTDIQAILSVQAEKALQDYEAALKLLPVSEYVSQHPSLLEAKLKSAQLLLSQNDFSALLKSHHALTPLRKYLTVWWYWRKLRKAAQK